MLDYDRIEKDDWDGTHHLKVDTFEHARSTAQDLMQIHEFICNNRETSIWTKSDRFIDSSYDYFSIRSNHLDDDGYSVDMFNINKFNDPEYDPKYSGGFLSYSPNYDRIKFFYVDTDIVLPFIEEELTEELFFQMSTVDDPYIVGVQFMFSWLKQNNFPPFYVDLTFYDLIWNFVRNPS
ncbi:hypothetical protein FOI42_RS03370 [Escherichia coli]|nr:hypothetical protein [Escherichia coli]MED6699349.1 hypothetical protein [Escherichia coli O157]